MMNFIVSLLPILGFKEESVEQASLVFATMRHVFIVSMFAIFPT